jgi:Helix-turn-helix family
MDDAAHTARTMWTLFEPVHAMTYFGPQARAEYEQAGLRGFWRGYFAGRAAPLGETGAAVVTAAFGNFAPSMVARAIPDIWDLITPQQALASRLAGAVAALRPLLAGLGPQVETSARLLSQAIGELDTTGRVLAAANAALPWPDEPLERLWHAATLLREHRGDGHLAALVAAGVDGTEALVLRSGKDLRREDLQPVRGWTDAQWEDAQGRLEARGWLDRDGRLTGAGAKEHRDVERATDRAAARPWLALASADLDDLRQALTPIAQACAAVLPYPSPIGVPAPASASAASG